MARFIGTKGDHRKAGSVGRTQRGTGQIAARTPWERQVESQRRAAVPGAVERALEQARVGLGRPQD